MFDLTLCLLSMQYKLLLETKPFKLIWKISKHICIFDKNIFCLP